MNQTDREEDVPNPTYPLTPPRFLTRNNPDFLKAQLSLNPKSDSKTHTPSVHVHKHPAMQHNVFIYKSMYKHVKHYIECVIIANMQICAFPYSYKHEGWGLSHVNYYSLSFKW